MTMGIVSEITMNMISPAGTQHQKNVVTTLTFGCNVDNQISTYASTEGVQILKTTNKL